MKILKAIGLILKWSGVVLLFLSLLGMFEHPERINFYENLQQQKEIQGNSRLSRQLMKDYGFPQQQIELIQKIILKDLRFGKMGRSVAGKAVAVSTDGRKRTIADLIELRSWAYSKSKFYDWIAFSLILVGLILESILHIKENKGHKVAT